ncbi:MAG: RNA polymerase subunit sigma-70 [Deltaproteobacteria bacterium]|nr:RNA polymerase subunit sigma-70 [Deltaproteobacteria bacterium]
MPEASDEDVRLMLAFSGGDEAAFDLLFDRWSGRLLRFLERMVRDPAVAEELLQESFLRVHRARDRYQPQARFSTWLYTIATNVARNELRRPFRRSPHDSTDDEGDGAPLTLVADAPATDEVVEARRQGDAVEAALETLPERQRSALWLSAVEGLSYAEVAVALETTEKSVKALVHRARVALSRQMGSKETPHD